MRWLAAALLVATTAAAAPSADQCKASCKSTIKPECEKACRTQPPKYVNPCIKQMCEMAVQKCNEMCVDKAKKR
jgi:hypothetical protein